MANLHNVLKAKTSLCWKSQSHGFSSSHVQMWELNHKKGWAPKNWYFGIVMLEKILEGPLEWKEIKPINPKGNQPCIFIVRTDAEAESPILWPPGANSWLFRKDPDAGKYWGQKKGTTESEMIGWHHRLNGYEFEQTQGDSEGQGGLVCCSPWGCRESDTTELLNNRRMRGSTQCKVWGKSGPQGRTGRVKARLGMTWDLQKQERLEWMEPFDREGKREGGGELNTQGVPRAEILGTRILGSWHADIIPSVMGGGFCF